MSDVTFDTLESVESLRGAGFNEAQAKGMVNVFKKVQRSLSEEWATKTDIAEIKTDIAEIKTDIAEIKGEIRLNRWMLVLIIAVVVLPALKSLFSS